MPVTGRTEAAHHKESTMVSLLTGWAQQGVQSFFATQRILLDLAMRQNAAIMHTVRQQLTDPHYSPAALLSESAAEGLSNFLEGQKVLLELGKQQNEILMTGVRERVGESAAAQAITDLLQRSVDTFIRMQEEFLKIAGKQTHTWVEAAKGGKPYRPEELVDMAREGMEHFMKAQKQFMDIIADETSKATTGRRNGAKKTRKTELREIARKATDSFIEAQKRFVDLAGQQMNSNVKAAGNALESLKPFPFPPLSELAREGVKSYVDAQKALMDAMMRPMTEHKPVGKTPRKRPAHAAKAAAAGVA